ncbi:type I pantothenate kinase [Candidatus Pantoea edessiphila]|uniref:Pantothenate kinase n=1 Tax=Candidatus Pantoea edessiphila TaxID=2044610 RepID=A0A2P5SWF5_9GAMM|nr:type I pantothenate kinase [Candidatus Pantoea edessiphila]PPI86646.1 type I pantothenate kinase [Candidatus Pantoea edessiphila]
MIMGNFYLVFTRKEWANLCDSFLFSLSNDEINTIKGINDELSIKEVIEIYLPLSRLINFFIDSNFRHKEVIEKFLGKTINKVPYIIGISGSVAVGKSTAARVLQTLMSRYNKNNKVELVTTDGFLYPNTILEKKGLMKKKGFPQSYNISRLMKFVLDLKLGAKQVIAPAYSHSIYDILPKTSQIIQQPDILILEGLNVLQNVSDYPDNPYRIFISDFIDFSIYIDAIEDLLKKWYIDRFLKLRESAFTKSESYFCNYASLTKQKTITIAENLWNSINKINLKENILPTRERANVILTKTNNHFVYQIRLKR